MRKSSQHAHHDTGRCCAMCGGKFGLVRYYCWQTALYSHKCVDRFKARREADHTWLRWLRAAYDDDGLPRSRSAAFVRCEVLEPQFQ
jgi:hypothetical protein